MIMGNRDAKAIRPKPSIMGSRPGVRSARPTPSAVTRGTVTVEVVTPPQSKAIGTMKRGASVAMANTSR